MTLDGTQPITKEQRQQMWRTSKPGDATLIGDVPQWHPALHSYELRVRLVEAQLDDVVRLLRKFYLAFQKPEWQEGACADELSAEVHGVLDDLAWWSGIGKPVTPGPYPPSRKPPPRSCAGCGKLRANARVLMELGPGMCICDECARLCVDLVADPQESSVAGGSNDGIVWTNEPPSEPGYYLYWNGDGDWLRLMNVYGSHYMIENVESKLTRWMYREWRSVAPLRPPTPEERDAKR